MMQKNQTNTIEIFVNGEPREVPAGLTVSGLLVFLGVEGGRVAVEVGAEGLEDIRRSIANFEWTQPTIDVPGVRVYNLPPATPAGK